MEGLGRSVAFTTGQPRTSSQRPAIASYLASSGTEVMRPKGVELHALIIGWLMSSVDAKFPTPSQIAYRLQATRLCIVEYSSCYHRVLSRLSPLGQDVPERGNNGPVRPLSRVPNREQRHVIHTRLAAHKRAQIFETHRCVG